MRKIEAERKENEIKRFAKLGSSTCCRCVPVGLSVCVRVHECVNRCVYVCVCGCACVHGCVNV